MVPGTAAAAKAGASFQQTAPVAERTSRGRADDDQEGLGRRGVHGLPEEVDEHGDREHGASAPDGAERDPERRAGDERDQHVWP
jgi:hypothetical protein